MPRIKRRPRRRTVPATTSDQAPVPAPKRHHGDVAVSDQEVDEHEAERLLDLKKYVGLDDLWEVGASVPPRPVVVPVHIATELPDPSLDSEFNTNPFPIGQIDISCDSAGISNALADHVHCNMTELMVYLYPSEDCYTVMRVASESHLNPMLVSRRSLLLLPAPAVVELTRLCRAKAIDLHLSLPVTSPTSMSLTVMVNDGLLETGSPDRFTESRDCTLLRLAELFFPDLLPVSTPGILQRQNKGWYDYQSQHYKD